ncbi:uncharacterized protein LOC117103852 isoform X2 [Anneissia japonica]|nr:uncharacterized protein LOC117103852 isoform X2 [Anneissia japonica]
MRLGMALEDDNIRKIKQLYKKKLVKNYQDTWSLIMDLEHQMIICEGRMEDFIDILKELELLQAVNALTEDISSASSNSGSLEDVSDLCSNSVQECVEDVANVSPNSVEEFVEGIVETHVRKRIRRSSDSEGTGKKRVCKRKIISSDCEGIVDNSRRHSDSADIALRLIHSVNLQCRENYEFNLVKLLEKPRDSLNSTDKEQLLEIIKNLKNYCSSLGLDLNKLINNCIVFCLSAYDSIGLLSLWKMHISRKLIEDLADILVPQEHQQLFLDEWITYIDENEYKGALMKLMEKGKTILMNFKSL